VEKTERRSRRENKTNREGKGKTIRNHMYYIEQRNGFTDENKYKFDKLGIYIDNSFLNPLK